MKLLAGLLEVSASLSQVIHCSSYCAADVMAKLHWRMFDLAPFLPDAITELCGLLGQQFLPIILDGAQNAATYRISPTRNSSQSAYHVISAKGSRGSGNEGLDYAA